MLGDKLPIGRRASTIIAECRQERVSRGKAAQFCRHAPCGRACAAISGASSAK
jgi:hypothetical protein